MRSHDGVGIRRGATARTCRAQMAVAAVLLVLLQFRGALLYGPKPLQYRDELPDGATDAWRDLDHLVIVCGHAVLTTHDALTEETVLRDESWSLEAFQRGQVPTFVAHIKLGVELAASDAKALLLFSGGMTRQGAGPRSEAHSYWDVADAFGWHGHPSVRERALTENHAHDSFENVLFSLCRFRELTGRYPAQLTVVSFGFKEARFTRMHRDALRWPRRRFRFVGVDPAGGVSQAVRDGEHLNSAALFESDPYGCLDSRLAHKRQQRNPFHSTSGYPKQCPELEELFAFCSRQVFRGELPWAQGSATLAWAS